jgi:hypothetical protein
MAPRLMMNTADVAKTGAVQPGSRVSWRYKFAGTPQQLADYEKWLLPKLGPEHRWIGLQQDDSALANRWNARSSFAAVGAADSVAGGGRGGGGDEPLLPQPLRSGGDPQNPGRRTRSCVSLLSASG